MGWGGATFSIWLVVPLSIALKKQAERGNTEQKNKRRGKLKIIERKIYSSLFRKAAAEQKKTIAKRWHFSYDIKVTLSLSPTTLLAQAKKSDFKLLQISRFASFLSCVFTLMTSLKRSKVGQKIEAYWLPFFLPQPKNWPCLLLSSSLSKFLRGK